MEAGDIPGAVRFFESAVQKEPDNQLVRLLQPVSNSLITLLLVNVLVILLMFVSSQKAVVMMLWCAYISFH